MMLPGVTSGQRDRFDEYLNGAGLDDGFFENFSVKLDGLTIRMDGAALNFANVATSLEKRDFDIGVFFALFSENFDAAVNRFGGFGAVGDLFAIEDHRVGAGFGGIIFHGEFGGDDGRPIRRASCGAIAKKYESERGWKGAAQERNGNTRNVLIARDGSHAYRFASEFRQLCRRTTSYKMTWSNMAVLGRVDLPVPCKGRYARCGELSRTVSYNAVVIGTRSTTSISLNFRAVTARMCLPRRARGASLPRYL